MDNQYDNERFLPNLKEPFYNTYCMNDEKIKPCLISQQKEFNDTYLFTEQRKPALCEQLKHNRKKLKLSKVVTSLFPILIWLPAYKWHTDLFHDVISGLTVAIMHIPQGLAYSILAGVVPVVGIYMAFFPVLIYTMMGTSRQLSMGTFAIVCMMTGKSVLEYANDHISPKPEVVYTPIDVATAVCLVVGIWQLLLGTFRLGALCVLLSEHLISGLVTGTAILVINSQLKHLFGLSLPKYNGSLKVIHTISNVINQASLINLMAVSITLGVLGILLSYQQFLKDKINKKIHFPVPTELIVIVTGSLLSKYLHLPENYKLTVVGEIPTGFPPLSVPALSLLPNLIVDGFVIAVISFSINISMGTMFAEKHRYRINANQELIASGSANMFGSLFSCAPFAASLSRSLIQDTTGGRTQLASVVSCCFLTIVILFIAPFFKELPHCVLTGIVLCAMKGILVNLKDVFVAYRQSKADSLIWLLTFFSVVLIDMDIGLCVGLIASLIHIILLGQKVKVLEYGNIPNTDIYVCKKHYKAAHCVPEILVLHIIAGMNFANRDSVRRNILRKVKKNEDLEIKYVLLDMEAVTYIDPSSVKSLISIYESLKTENINLSLAKCSSSLLKIFTKCNFFTVFPETQIYSSLHEAVLSIQYK